MPANPRLRRWLAGIAALALINLLSLAALLMAAESRVDTPPANVPAIAILFGDDIGLGATTLRSLRYAMSIASAEADFLAIGGGRPEIGYSGACDMRDWLVAHGVPPLRITPGTRSFDTAGNLIELRTLAVGVPHGPVVLVADSLHALRISYLLHGEAQPRIRLVPFTLFGGTAADLGQAVQRAQYELVAWLLYFCLPESWYHALLKRLRYNTQGAGQEVTCAPLR